MILRGLEESCKSLIVSTLMEEEKEEEEELGINVIYLLSRKVITALSMQSQALNTALTVNSLVKQPKSSFATNNLIQIVTFVMTIRHRPIIFREYLLGRLKLVKVR